MKGDPHVTPQRRGHGRHWAAAVLLLASAPTSLGAQVRTEGASGDPAAPRPAAAAPTGPTEDGRPVVRPTRTDTPPEIDGAIDDPVWQTAVRLTEFWQQQPLDGAPASEETEVWVAYDDDHIYFAVHAHYQDRSIMRANRVDRDRAAQDDLLTVYFDTYLDQQRGYDFDVNGYGVQGDGIIVAGGPGGAIPRADRTWNTLFRSAGQLVEDGYTAEMAIPFKSLRYPQKARDEEHRWGFQIVREVKSKDEENIVWAPMSRDESSFFAQMGILEGMTNLSTSRNLEILPTFTAIQYGELDAPAAHFDNRDTDPDAGVNLKYGVTSNLTADFALNPDFSQIESDSPQIEVNQRFPIFFSELRPFFVEGAEIFNIPSPVTFVHTRTIVDPDWGAKLSGEIGSTSVGFVATNDRGPGKVDDPSDPAFDRSAYTFIGRVRRDLYSDSNIGAVFTNREFMDSHSRLGGVDGLFRLTPTLQADFRAVGAWHRDVAGVDREGHVLATRMVQNGRNVTGSLQAYQVSPDFRTDVGFVRRTDQRVLSGTVGYRFWPESWIINWGPELTLGRTWDYDEVLQDEEVTVGLDFDVAGNVSLGAEVGREMERFGGIDFEKTRFSLNGNVNASRRFSFGANLGGGDQIRYVADPFLGDGLNWGVNATLRPISRLESRLNLSSSRLTDPRNRDEEVFDVTILRAHSTYQFTERLSARNITEYNTFDETFGFNLLFNYRVNAGTVFFVGYDDHYQHAELIEDLLLNGPREDRLFLPDGLQRTRRALFVKFQYLLRY